MKAWKKALGDIRALGPDIPPFREDVKLVWDHIAKLEDALERCRPFIEVEARLANSGLGKPGRGDAPRLLDALEALRD